jgi:hypothetical protein
MAKHRKHLFNSNKDKDMFSKRAILAGMTSLALGACVVAPPPPPPRPAPSMPPHEAALRRMQQIEQRIGQEQRSIDAHVNGGAYPPPIGDRLHGELGRIDQEAHDMANQHGGGLSGEEQHDLNDQLNGVTRRIER